LPTSLGDSEGNRGGRIIFSPSGRLKLANMLISLKKVRYLSSVAQSGFSVSS